MLIGVIDYKAGNLRSVCNALEYTKRSATTVVTEPSRLKGCDKIVLPGVGAFGRAMEHLRAAGFVDALQQEVLYREKLFLGICLGMQLVMSRSHEHGLHQGLDWVPGEVLPFSEVISHKVPHMGWNDITIRRPSPLLDGISDQTDFYFLHSFYVSCQEPGHVLATCDYGIDFTAVLGKDNIFGVQFHPEKSQRYGVNLCGTLR